MPAKKIKDIAVKTGEYQDRSSGETKGRYLNVGALMKNEDGSVFILLQRTFNPAGVNSDRDTVLLSCFDLRDDSQQSSGGGGSSGGGSQRPAAQRPIDDDIAF
jgi:hypothetical protein